MIYLNDAASAWPKAPGVIAAMVDAMAMPPEHPGRSSVQTADSLVECRERIAVLLGTSAPSRIVLTTHATQALNLAILGLSLPVGAHVITTISEHNSVLRPLWHLQQQQGVRLTIIGFDALGRLDLSAFERALAEGAELVAVNHVSNVTGAVNAVAQLFAQAKGAGAVTLLDAAQSLGHLPVRAEEIGADLVAFTGHKGLRGPTGTGGLYVAPGIELAQVFVGGTGVRSDARFHPPEMPMRLEAGTPNVPAFAGLAAALRWQAQHGDEFIRRERILRDRLHDALREIPRVELFDGDPAAEHLAIISFRIRGWEVEEVGYVLAESFGITCRTGLHCAPLIHHAIGSAPDGTIRFSLSGFTTEQDIETAIIAIRKLAA